MVSGANAEVVAPNKCNTVCSHMCGTHQLTLIMRFLEGVQGMSFDESLWHQLKGLQMTYRFFSSASPLNGTIDL